MNMAIIWQSASQFEPIIKGLKSDTSMQDSIAKEKKWGKNVWKL